MRMVRLWALGLGISSILLIAEQNPFLHYSKLPHELPLNEHFLIIKLVCNFMTFRELEAKYRFF